ncbi:MAG: hypothetical protein KF845_06875 [Cyclobacteriaceae bacterium]|nr:hypothetical protein [Cyclobacteriaceae bacterium]
MTEYLITSGFLDRQRKLVLADDYLEWENGDLKGREFTRLNRSDIVDFKHGVDWIVWYKFTVGRKFSVTFKDKGGKEFKILFNSYFGLHKENHHKYADIVDNVWRLYHSNIVDNFLDRFYNQGEVEIQGIKLKNEGIELREKIGLVPWNKVAIKDYYRYFAIYNRDNSDLHSRVSYNEYGTETLWSAIKTILKEREMDASQQNV